jgi:hypothetical protein
MTGWMLADFRRRVQVATGMAVGRDSFVALTQMA